MKLSKILIFIIFIVISCSPGKEEQQDKIKHLSFSENDELLSNEIVYDKCNFRIRYPKNTDKLGEAEVKNIQMQLNDNVLDEYSSEIMDIFFVKEKNIIISVSRITGNKYESYSELLEFLDKNYLVDFKNRRSLEFFKDEFFMAQLMYYNDTNMILKTFVKNPYGQDFEINFLMPSDQYNDFSRSIESVLASIHGV